MLGKNKKAEEVIRVSMLETERIEGIMGDTIESVFTDARYGFISGALKETFKPGTENRHKISDSIDHLLTNRYFGFPVFLFFMWVMFTATFNVGAFPQQWIESGVSYISLFLNSIMAEGSLKRLIIDGIIGGVGGVVVFLPNIMILFFFISIMEDTGYMARAAFITDKLMHKIGLHGKSFIPLIMGFGCNVPAIMATRTIENRSNRLLTMLINPFMSCSARLPVYILLIGAVFPSNKGSLLFSVYMIGILVAILVALIFKNTLFKTTDAPFVMELPPYRLPTVRSITRHMWMKASQYLKKMGGVIMLASIIIWALGHYPVQKIPVAGQTSQTMVQSGTNENSYIARIGKFIEPAIMPLGFDWRMGISLVTGVAAKEIVVSTMGVVYQDNGKNLSLEEKIQNARYTQGKREGMRVFTPLATLSFLIFTLLYFPCLPTVTAIYNESGALKWALFSIVFTTGMAWLLSFIIYQTGMLFI
jgi:ferrous iron transport protein B